MEKTKLNLLLADDDIDDCDFFKDALEEISVPANLSTVNNGVELMNLLLTEPVNYPDIIFLDLNMPRKSGMECISEIKAIDKLNHIPIIIYSTSLDMNVVNLLYDKGAHYYIQKPGKFAVLKKVIKEAITQFHINNSLRPTREKFIIQP
ncbi:response regulator [Mariniflexile litorale]|uniref:Response regulator n=1 Tax=Mariniflexile litorale TaxID=3045158 RepID=A0AAU7EKM4_9FLAO|nr:response regulator [Mariniflexile sp. KMM 9835]MDQ8213250.1 response regulator [Mariniflexile sp. KMM 9835]